jgi:hypothetical protein
MKRICKHAASPETLVEIESLAGDGTRRIVKGFRAKPHAIAPGCIGAYYPETNPLLPLAHHDVKCGTPAARSIPVLVRFQAQKTWCDAFATSIGDFQFGRAGRFPGILRPVGCVLKCNLMVDLMPQTYSYSRPQNAVTG